jgi:hypothetical protein
MKTSSARSLAPTTAVKGMCEGRVVCAECILHSFF